jgi:hypothetical protein
MPAKTLIIRTHRAAPSSQPPTVSVTSTSVMQAKGLVRRRHT